MEERPKLDVDMLGVRFSLQADEDISYLESLVNCYRSYVKTASSYVKESEGDYPFKAETSLKMAILAGVLLADSFFKQKANMKEFDRGIGQRGKGSETESAQLLQQKGDLKEFGGRLIESLMSQLDSVLKES